jgi:hypothetical protein
MIHHPHIITISRAIKTIVNVLLPSQFMSIVRAYKVFAFTTLTVDEVAVKVGS